MQKCSICDLDSSSVGDLEVLHSMSEKNGHTVKTSIFVCSGCKPYAEDWGDKWVKPSA